MNQFNLKQCVVVLAAFMMSLASAFGAAKHPNIVVLFCDDLGYGDLGSYGNPTIATPRLDAMAAEGMRLTQFYSAAAVCSPSRASLLTGRYPPRHGTINIYHHKLDTGMNPAEVTVAELLSGQGYATACVGKWHLGHDPEFLPLAQGFGRYFGIPYSNDMQIDPEMPFATDAVFREGWTLDKVRALNWETNKPKREKVPLMRDNLVVEFPADQRTLTARYTDEALDFMAASAGRPFFLYLAYTMPHVPLFASAEFAGKSRRGLYGDTVEEIDASVGRLLDYLQQNGLADNTLVFFTSDNGPWLTYKHQGGSQGLLRGGKFTTWEGGHRMPAIAWWPGHITSAVSAEVASTLDVFTTAVRLGGAELPTDRVIDGQDLSGLLFKGRASPRHDFAYYRKDVLQAYRFGPWKIHLRVQPERAGPPGDWLETPLLFNVETDPAEQYDLAAEHPDIVADLLRRAEAYKHLQ